MADLNSTITTMNDAIENIQEDDTEDVRRLYEQQLDLTVDDSSEGDTMLITATNTDTDSQCDSSGWPVKKYRINTAKCSKRTRREHRTQTGSSSRITIYPTTLRYRYKHEFHGYQCQPSSRSIITPPLSLRSMVTYDKGPVVAARDVLPKRPASLLSTTDSGYHGYNSLTSKSQSRSHSSSIRKSTKYRNTPPELQRNVRIQCNLLPYDEGVLNLKETRTGTEKFNLTPVVEKRSVAMQHRGKTPSPPPPTLTVDVIVVDVTDGYTQTDMKQYENRADNTTIIYSVKDNFAQCSTAMSAVAIQCVQPNVKNSGMQSDHVLLPARPIIDRKHVTTQYLPDDLDLLQQQNESSIKLSSPNSFLQSTSTSIVTAAKTQQVASATDAALDSASQSDAIAEDTESKAASVTAPPGQATRRRPQSAFTPHNRRPLTSDVTIHAHPLSRPRADLYHIHTDEKIETVRLKQDDNNNNNNNLLRQRPSSSDNRRRSIDWAPLPHHHRVRHRGTLEQSPEPQYQGLYRLVD